MTYDDPTVPLRFDRWEFCVGILILVKPDVGVCVVFTDSTLACDP